MLLEEVADLETTDTQPDPNDPTPPTDSKEHEKIDVYGYIPTKEPQQKMIDFYTLSNLDEKFLSIPINREEGEESHKTEVNDPTTGSKTQVMTYGSKHFSGVGATGKHFPTYGEKFENLEQQRIAMLNDICDELIPELSDDIFFSCCCEYKHCFDVSDSATLDKLFDTDPEHQVELLPIGPRNKAELDADAGFKQDAPAEPTKPDDIEDPDEPDYENLFLFEENPVYRKRWLQWAKASYNRKIRENKKERQRLAKMTEQEQIADKEKREKQAQEEYDKAQEEDQLRAAEQDTENREMRPTHESLQYTLIKEALKKDKKDKKIDPTEEKKYYNQGAGAFYAGKIISDCPYTSGGERIKPWLRGMMAAEFDGYKPPSQFLPPPTPPPSLPAIKQMQNIIASNPTKFQPTSWGQSGMGAKTALPSKPATFGSVASAASKLNPNANTYPSNTQSQPSKTRTSTYLPEYLNTPEIKEFFTVSKHFYKNHGHGLGLAFSYPSSSETKDFANTYNNATYKKEEDNDYTKQVIVITKMLDQYNVTKKEFVDLSQWLYNNVRFSGGNYSFSYNKSIADMDTYGGANWAMICRAWLTLDKYKKSSLSWKIYAIDTAYHAQHNTGSVFTKLRKYDVGGYSWVKRMLDTKTQSKDYFKDIIGKASLTIKKLASQYLKAIVNFSEEGDTNKPLAITPDVLQGPHTAYDYVYNVTAYWTNIGNFGNMKDPKYDKLYNVMSAEPQLCYNFMKYMTGGFKNKSIYDIPEILIQAVETSPSYCEKTLRLWSNKYQNKGDLDLGCPVSQRLLKKLSETNSGIWSFTTDYINANPTNSDNFPDKFAQMLMNNEEGAFKFLEAYTSYFNDQRLIDKSAKYFPDLVKIAKAKYKNTVYPLENIYKGKITEAKIIDNIRGNMFYKLMQ